MGTGDLPKTGANDNINYLAGLLLVAAGIVINRKKVLV